MSKSVIQIEGFAELQQKIKSLGNDKVKRKEVLKILGQVANPTVKAARSLAPVNKGLRVRGKTYARRKRQIGKRVINNTYVSGLGKKSIGKKNMRKTKNAVVYVSPRSVKSADGFY
jgi:hypothetical protein